MIDFVPISSAGNADDETGFGAVDYPYEVAVAEITIGQFLAAADVDHKIRPAGGDFAWLALAGDSAPATNVSWYDAARFANWLTSGDAHRGVYQFDGDGNFLATDRDGALKQFSRVYALPTEDEWYKSAYFGAHGYSDFAFGPGQIPSFRSHPNRARFKKPEPAAVPFGSIEQNGTRDLMGNVAEWTESAVEVRSSSEPDADRALRGGSYGEDSGAMARETRRGGAPNAFNRTIGFRVVAINR